MTETKATEYAAGLRSLADFIEANPDISTSFSFALGHMSSPNQSYEQLDALAAAGASSGVAVKESVDSEWRHVSVSFGPVTCRGYGRAQKDPNAPCPTCGMGA
ncbi:MAG TPA: hypothetical protein VFC19_49515 [Candidatus Limnocylindrales bacterium]|nr:hypothetical protein [Candidatus Limnocylindrales bacterium]